MSLRVRAAVVPLVCLSLIAYFGYHLVSGERGLDARARLEKRITTLKGEVEGLKAVRDKLERDVSLLRADQLDPDMLGERARAILNFAHPDDIILVEPRQDAARER
jgi:cell division protein FtsB